ncbi:MAG: hypothetical protein J0I07_24390 [Myxococcales bacterium]|nr:hypothetical protein [Myxococcales bacterium]
MYKRISSYVAFVCIPLALIAACSDTVLIAAGPSRSETIFGSEDGGSEPDGAASSSGGVELTQYCPSNKCPTGYTNCPTSQFPCDVNLMIDRRNCGECGVECPTNAPTGTYECVDGQCVLACRPHTGDCDGIPDNGCETSFRSSDSCGGCGIKCTDPAKPCIPTNPIASDYACGCLDPDKIACGLFCVDPRTNDGNCGACGNVCRADDGPPLDPSLHAYYGCLESECGKRKCQGNWANCDGDQSNGCETRLTTSENCGACGNACPNGQECRSEPGGGPKCMCPDGELFCIRNRGQDIDVGYCIDVASDPDNCGGCGISCFTPGGTGLCVNGACRTQCSPENADCNGNPHDGCEVAIDRDPGNCGGCGVVCDAIAGQACVGGRCVVEPCEDAGPEPGVEAK